LRGDLDGLQADFAFVLRTGCDDSHDGAANGAERVLVQDDFDHLAAPKLKTASQAKAFLGGIQDEAWQPFLASVKINYEAGALLEHGTLGTAALRHRKAGHSLVALVFSCCRSVFGRCRSVFSRCGRGVVLKGRDAFHSETRY